MMLTTLILLRFTERVEQWQRFFEDRNSDPHLLDGPADLEDILKFIQNMTGNVIGGSSMSP